VTSLPLSAAEQIDPTVHAAFARLNGSLSPESLLSAWMDWAAHMATSPGKRLDLLRLAFRQTERLARYLRDCQSRGSETSEACLAVKAKDRRFAAEEWQRWPFNVMQQSFLLTQEWWDAATHDVWGVEKHHEDLVSFFARQMLDALSPGNQLWTNPVVWKRTMEQSGTNLVRGALNALDDFERTASKAPAPGSENFVVGRDVAVTPGKVIYKNRLIELIQYTPTTEKVQPEPVLIVPAWIMKYYILDLSPHNSLVKYLVENGHTVFCISWKNPGWDERDLGMDDYLELGLYAALDAINTIVPKAKVHAAGYCIGGTLLSIGAAAMGRDGNDRLASMTLFAAQTDFSEPGELALFIDESQLSMLEAQMAESGYLTADQMAGAFQMLRSYDLLWSRIVNEYLLGERAPLIDLMAWNADATRMPAKMHSQYLRRLFLNDDLAQGRYPVNGRPVTLRDIDLPVFSVGTVTDHVAPWRSVFKLHYLMSGEITFVLTSGGHNAGIVSPPGRPRRSYQSLTLPADSAYISAEEWLEEAPRTEGSWWPAWHEWLTARSGAPVKAPQMGAPGKGYKALYDAPGEYVREM